MAVADEASRIGPVAVPETVDDTVAVPTPVIPSEPEKPSSLQRAEEILAVAIAQAQAFSPRVGGLQESISRTVQQQFANGVLTDSKSTFAKRHDTRWRPSGVFGTGVHSRDSAGDFAGDEYLRTQSQRLQTQLDDLTNRYETTLQEEAWLTLSSEDQALIIEHNLIPQEVRDTALANSQAIPGLKRIAMEEPSAELNQEDWVLITLEGTTLQAAFPGTPTKSIQDGTTTYSATANGRTLTIEYTPKIEVPEGLTLFEIPRTLAESNVLELKEQGGFGALRTSSLSRQPAIELCVFHRSLRRDAATYCRYATVGRDFIAAQVADANVTSDPIAARFFDSIRWQ